MIEKELSKYLRNFEIFEEYMALKHSNKNFFHRTLGILALKYEYQFLPYYVRGVPKWRLKMRQLLAKKRITPNYIITGPIKCGSTDLVTHLLSHPNIMAPLAKEFNITDAEVWRAYYPTIKEKNKLQKKIKGNIRCGYLYPLLHDVKLIERLGRLNPKPKVIITLRDPVKRAYSHWKWEVLVGGQDAISENDFLNNYSTFVRRALDFHPSIPMDTFCNFHFLETGIYYKAVELWINKFGRDNVLVVDVADYFVDRQPVFKKIQEFLDIPPIHIPESTKKLNENHLKLEKPDQKSVSALTEFYKPYNKKLFTLLETHFDWEGSVLEPSF
ncbi:MAG: sulfotransferase domain-containing protein [Bacteroidota bacterium]